MILERLRRNRTDARGVRDAREATRQNRQQLELETFEVLRKGLKRQPLVLVDGHSCALVDTEILEVLREELKQLRRRGQHRLVLVDEGELRHLRNVQLFLNVLLLVFLVVLRTASLR